MAGSTGKGLTEKGLPADSPPDLFRLFTENVEIEILLAIFHRCRQRGPFAMAALNLAFRVIVTFQKTDANALTEISSSFSKALIS